MPPNGFEAWQQARAPARPRPPAPQHPASSSSSSASGPAAGSTGDGDGDADAAILAQIRALQARLSSSSSEHVAANIPSASSAQRRPTAHPPVASSSSSASRTSILAPASPPRASASASAASTASSSTSSTYRGPQYISSRAHTGVQSLIQQAASAPRPRPPKPRPQWFLKHAQQRQEEAAQQKDIASSTGLTRDDRLALMENMDLKPGPIDFGRGMHNDYEPYSGQRLRGGRLISHEDFNEIMTGRYFLSPSQLYSIRVPAIGRKKGADGDFDVPVPGDFVIVVTITSASDTIVPKEDEEDKLQESNARLVDEEEWLGSMGRSSNISSSAPPGGRGFQINSLDHRKPPKGPLRWFDLQDLSSRPVDGQSEGRGDCMLKLMVKKASHRDKETGEYSGGSRGAFEKLEAERSGGAVIAIINPILLGDKKKGRPRKDGTEPTDVNASNSVMTIMARDAESLFIIGRCKDYASCTALKADGQKCKKFVDRRTSTCRGPALCDYHLDNGAQRAHKGRQELANTTSSFFGGGGSIGYGRDGEDGEGRKKQTSGWAAWRAKKEGRGGRSGGGYTSSGRPWEPRPPRTGDLTYGLEGGAVSRQQFVVADTAQASLSHNDPQSQRFSVRDAYGREKEERELRKRKREEEGRVLRELERKRAGYVGLEGSLVRRDGGEEGTPGGGGGEEAVPFTLPSHSTGALAIADAQKTLQERKEKAAKAAAAKAVAGSSSRKKSKTAAAPTATSRNNALRLDDSDEDSSSDLPSASQDPLTQSLSSSQQHQPHQSRWRHSASAIKLMGFDPLSDLRSRQNRNGSGSSATDLVTSSLLRRHAASNADLPEARLSLKRGEKRRSGVRAPPPMTGVGVGEGRREGGGVGRGVGGQQQQVVEISDDDDGALEIV